MYRPLRIRHLVLMAWVGSQMQLLWPLFTTVRKEECHLTGPNLNARDTKGVGHRTMLGDHLDNAAIATSLADAAGFCTVSTLLVKQTKAMVDGQAMLLPNALKVARLNEVSSCATVACLFSLPRIVYECN